MAGSGAPQPAEETGAESLEVSHHRAVHRGSAAVRSPTAGGGFPTRKGQSRLPPTLNFGFFFITQVLNFRSSYPEAKYKLLCALEAFKGNEFGLSEALTGDRPPWPDPRTQNFVTCPQNCAQGWLWWTQEVPGYPSQLGFFPTYNSGVGRLG